MNPFMTRGHFAVVILIISQNPESNPSLLSLDEGNHVLAFLF